MAMARMLVAIALASSGPAWGQMQATSEVAAQPAPGPGSPAPGVSAIAGLQPDRRPVLAPRITASAVAPFVQRQRLAGISEPLPGNVAVIAEQGAGYSPMFYRGMPGRYDIRGLHTPPSPVGTTR